jgi:hypothetical protein
MPLIVLTQAAPGALGGWADLQRGLAERSHRGRQVLVADSGHAIPEEAPDAVIGAVRDVVTTVRDERR